jgi:hypothetical protein
MAKCRGDEGERTAEPAAPVLLRFKAAVASSSSTAHLPLGARPAIIRGKSRDTGILKPPDVRLSVPQSGPKLILSPGGRGAS